MTEIPGARALPANFYWRTAFANPLISIAMVAGIVCGVVLERVRDGELILFRVDHIGLIGAIVFALAHQPSVWRNRAPRSKAQGRRRFALAYLTLISFTSWVGWNYVMLGVVPVPMLALVGAVWLMSILTWPQRFDVYFAAAERTYFEDPVLKVFR